MSPGAWLRWGILALAVSALLSLPSFAAQPSAEVAFVRGSMANQSSAWNAESFGWFYYDLDTRAGGEELRAEVDGRLAESGHIAYSSRAWSTEFEFKPWGMYHSIAFLGKSYFAGYPDSSFTDAVSSLEKGELRRVLIDYKDSHILSYDDPLRLAEGYVLAVKEVSENGDRINFLLLKNQKQVDDAVVDVGDTYVFKNSDDLPLILVHAYNAMQGERGGTVQIDAVFQVSETPAAKLSDGFRMGTMKLADLSEQEFLFKTDKDLTLTQDGIISLAPGLMLVVTNSSQLLYYPEGALAEYGHYEIRGPVFTGTSFVPISISGFESKALARWSFENFTGFYFDPEKGLGREMLALHAIDGREILQARSELVNGSLEIDGLQYTTLYQPRAFEHSSWGYYKVASFLSELWFAGYLSQTSTDISSKDLVTEERLGQILVDYGEPSEVSSGQTFLLANGYGFRIENISDDKVFANLLYSGKPVESAVVKSNSTYIYKKKWGDVPDFPVIAIHIQNVFSEANKSMATIDGVFQISDQAIPVEPGRGYVELEIVESTPNYIIMVNPDSINLNRDSSVDILPGMSIRVADNDTLRYYLYTNRYVVPKPRLARIDYPRNISSSARANFTMTVLAGEIAEVSAEIIDPSGRTIYSKDLTDLRMGSENIWSYFWGWNAAVLALSDDGSLVLDADQDPIPGRLYLNESVGPVPVGVRFDESGRIAGIVGNKEIYYISRSDYSLKQPSSSYDAMLNNSTARRQNIKIEPGRSLLQFYEYINGSSNLSSSNHTLTGSIESLEPHAERLGANPGRYEIRLRIENAADALQVSGLFFNVTAPEVRGALLGSNVTRAGETALVSLQIPLSSSERRVEISYDPGVARAAGVSGSCASSSQIDPKAGRIRVIFPPNCSSANLTFLAGQKNGTSKLEIVKVEGFAPDRLTNGSITVLSNGSAEMKQSNAPVFVLSLAAVALAAAYRRRH